MTAIAMPTWYLPTPDDVSESNAAARLHELVTEVLAPMSMVDETYDLESAWTDVMARAWDSVPELNEVRRALPTSVMPKVVRLELAIIGLPPEVKRLLRHAGETAEHVVAGFKNSLRMTNGPRALEGIEEFEHHEAFEELSEILDSEALHPNLALWLSEFTALFAAVIGARVAEDHKTKMFFARKAQHCAMSGARLLAAVSPQSLSLSVLAPEQRVSLVELQDEWDRKRAVMFDLPEAS